jgi:hypothetical protein
VKEQRAKGKGQKAKGKRQKAKGKEQKAKSNILETKIFLKSLFFECSFAFCLLPFAVFLCPLPAF